MDVYENINIWQRRERHVVRYVCLKSIDTNQYAVLKADFFRPSSTTSDFTYLDKHFVELMIEQSPADRCKWFDSLSEAITDHDNDFGSG